MGQPLARPITVQTAQIRAAIGAGLTLRLVPGRILLLLGVLVACGAGSLLVACDAPAAPLNVPTPIPPYNRQALNATVTALLHTLPTATLNPFAPPGKATDDQANDLYNRAVATAVALYPPPRTVPPD